MQRFNYFVSETKLARRCCSEADAEFARRVDVLLAERNAVRNARAILFRRPRSTLAMCTSSRIYERLSECIVTGHRCVNCPSDSGTDCGRPAVYSTWECAVAQPS